MLEYLTQGGIIIGEKIYELKRINKEGMGMPLIGDKFPKLEVQTTQGMMKLPKEFKGSWFILLVIDLISLQYVPLNSLLSN